MRMNTPPSTSWITRIVVALTTTALLILGFFFLTVALIVGAIAAVVIGARLWWTIRKLKRAHAESGGIAGGDRDPVVNVVNVVEGEYQVIEHESTSARFPPRQ